MRTETASPRQASIRQIFEGHHLVQQENVLLLGDFNMDPWRDDDVSTRYWNKKLGVPGVSSYLYYSGTAERSPPYPTLRYFFFERTYDHVVSNFLQGVTQALGESPGTARLDGGRGMDHSAVYGRLSFRD